MRSSRPAPPWSWNGGSQQTNTGSERENSGRSRSRSANTGRRVYSKKHQAGGEQSSTIRRNPARSDHSTPRQGLRDARPDRQPPAVGEPAQLAGGGLRGLRSVLVLAQVAVAGLGIVMGRVGSRATCCTGPTANYGSTSTPTPSNDDGQPGPRQPSAQHGAGPARRGPRRPGPMDVHDAADNTVGAVAEHRNWQGHRRGDVRYDVACRSDPLPAAACWNRTDTATTIAAADVTHPPRQWVALALARTRVTTPPVQDT